MTTTGRTASRRWLVPLCLALLLGGLALPAPAVGAVTTRHVTDCGDAGANTLRGQIAAAGAGDTIVFDQNCTITLATGTLTLTQNVAIDGTGHTVVVDGGCTTACGTGNAVGGVTVFAVNSGVTANLTALTIQHGNSGTSGGGIANSGILSVTNSTLSGNNANFGGGGITNFGGTLTVTDSTLSGNSNTFDVGGAGIENLQNGTVTVTNSTLSSNSASGAGGGIFSQFGTVTVTNSTVSGNSASDKGGGIYHTDGTLKVTNSTLSGNSGSSGGGGIANLGGNALTLTNSTLSGNSATGGFGGGGILISGAATLTNTIVANSTSGGDLSGSNPFSGNNNLIDDTSGTGFTDGTNGNIVGHPALLGPLGTDGGPTKTLPLLPGSPAIDAGDDPTCQMTGTGKVNGVDQRGITRPQGARCDIGAVEVRFTLTITSGTAQAAALSRPFVHPLGVTLGGADMPADRSGAPVTFTVHPVGGAGAALGTPNPATTDGSGAASVTATANGGAGTYTVTASAPGATAVTFSLTNAVLHPLPGVAPSGPAGGPATSLPGGRSAGSPGGVPNPLPISRP